MMHTIGRRAHAPPTQPLNERLFVASHQLTAMIQAGELDMVPTDTLHRLSTLSLMLLDCSSEAFELANAARGKTQRERRPWWFRFSGGRL